MSDLPPLPTATLGLYRHYKGGEYEVLGVVRHSETLEPLVLYRPLYGESGTWVRPFNMFFEAVTHAGVAVPRFALHNGRQDSSHAELQATVARMESRLEAAFFRSTPNLWSHYVTVCQRFEADLGRDSRDCLLAKSGALMLLQSIQTHRGVA